MATKIRLRRMGRRKRPFYRIVVIDSRDARDGKYIESLGYYDPLSHPTKIELDGSRVIDWLKKGAIPSNTVRNIMCKEGISLKWHLIRMGADEANIHEEMQKFELLQQSKKERIKSKKAAKQAESEEAETKSSPEGEAVSPSE